MDSVSSATLTNASSANLATVQGSASLSVLKKTLDQEASTATQLIAALPKPALATSGSVGTTVNTYA